MKNKAQLERYIVPIVLVVLVFAAIFQNVTPEITGSVVQDIEFGLPVEEEIIEEETPEETELEEPEATEEREQVIETIEETVLEAPEFDTQEDSFEVKDADGAPSLEFILPTPTDALSTTTTNHEFNVSIDESNLDQFTWNWNGTNTTLYNDSLVLMYNFDNVSALGENDTHVVDMSGNGNDGIVELSEWVSDGKYGGSFDFDSGSVQRINISTSPTLAMEQNSFTISAWIKATSGSKEMIYAYIGNESGVWSQFRLGSDSVYMAVDDDVVKTTLTGDVDVADDTWHHIVGVRDIVEDKLKIYVDGEFDKSGTDNTGSLLSQSYSVIGYNVATDPCAFDGQIDELRLYTRAFSPDEISEMYKSNLNKYNTTQWYFYTNQSSLSVGDYTYYAYVEDVDTAENQSSRTLTVTEAASPPLVSYEYPTPPNATSSVNTSYEFNVSIDESALEQFIWNWNGINTTIYDDTLIAYYNFDNISALNENDTQIADLTGEHNATCTVCPDWVSDGKYGGAFNYTYTTSIDSNTHFVLQDDSELDLNYDYTVIAWIYLEGSIQDDHKIISDNKSAWNWGLTDDSGHSGQIRLIVEDGGDVMQYSDTAVTSGVWQHVALTSNLTNVVFYLDGQEDGVGTAYDAGSDGNIYEMWIGEEGGPATHEGFNGRIDEVMIWNKSLSADEILNIYKSSLSKINSTQWYFYTNQSSLSLGDYTYYAYAEDTTSETNTTNTRTLTVSDSVVTQTITLNAPENATAGVSTDAVLNVTVIDSSGDTLNVSFYGVSPSEDNWTIILLPDTQLYSESAPNIFTNQTQWIVDNKDALNIKIVLSLGDLVDNWNVVSEWNVANESWSKIIDANIPAAIVPGDHDHDSEDPDGSTSYYDEYFPIDRFNETAWWGGNHNNNTNSYRLLTIGGDDYIFLSVDFCPDDDELAWVNTTLETYSDRKAIINTHAFLDDNGGYAGGDCDRVSGTTVFMWDRAFKYHDNLQLILSGHMHLDDGEANATVNNVNGTPVHQIMADYQARTNYGNGLLRILTFNPSNDLIDVKTYSPWINAYETDADSQFNLVYDMSSNDVVNIGNVTDVLNGSSVNASWLNLIEDTVYQWYVNVTKGATITQSSIWSFTTIGNIAVDFIAPTPPNATSSSNTSYVFNVSIEEADLEQFTWNWNGTNYTVYNDSLIAYYNFDNISALNENDTQIADLTGEHNATCTVCPDWLSDGKYGGAFNYTYTQSLNNNTHFVIPESSELDLDFTYTLSAWVYLEGSIQDDHKVIAVDLDDGWNWGPTDDPGYSGKIRVIYLIPSETKIYSDSVVTSDVWHHIAVVSNSTNVTFYLDGQEDGVSPSYDAGDTTNMWIGEEGGNNAHEGFNGKIDEVMIWNVSLSTEEIQQIYKSQLKKTNSTQWYFYTNQSGLSVGDYTYYAYVEDVDTAENQSSRTLTVSAAADNCNPITDTLLSENLSCTDVNIPVDIVFNTSTFSINATGAVEINGTLNASLGGDQDFGSITINSGGVYHATTGITTLTGISGNGNYQEIYNGEPGDMIHNNGTFLIAPISENRHLFFGDDNNEFYNVEINLLVSTNTVYMPYFRGKLTIENDLTVKEGIMYMDGNYETIVSGDTIIEDGGKLDRSKDVDASFNSLTINSGGEFTASPLTTTLLGNLSNDGTFTHNDGRVTFNGVDAYITNVIVFDNVTVSGNLTLSADVNYTAMNVTSTGNLSYAADNLDSGSYYYKETGGLVYVTGSSTLTSTLSYYNDAQLISNTPGASNYVSVIEDDSSAWIVSGWNSVPTIDTQNTFNNATAEHTFNVTAGVEDLDGGTDIVATNISTTSGSCDNIENSTSGNFFNSTWNCSGIALASAEIVIGFTDVVSNYVQTTASSNQYPNQVPTNPSSLTLNDVNVSDTLTATCSGSTDADAEDAVTYYYNFYNIGDDAVRQAWSTDNTYVIQASDVHDTINVTCGAYDATEFSVSNISTTKLVDNSIPTTPTTLTLNDVNVSDTLTASGSGSTDADSDSLTYYYTFYNVNDTTTVQDYSTDNTYVILSSDAHDTISVRTDTNDGYVNSTEKETNVTVGNLIPSITAVDVTPDSPNTVSTLTCTPAGWSDGDSDSESYYYQWYNNTTSISGATSSTYDCASDNSTCYRGINMTCQATPWDGYVNGIAINSSEIVENSAPTVSLVSISPASPEITNNLTCTVAGWSDADGEVQNYTFQWYNSSNLIMTIEQNETTHVLDSVNTTYAEVWNCSVTPWDGYVNGTTTTASKTVASEDSEEDTPAETPVTSGGGGGSGVVIVPIVSEDVLELNTLQKGYSKPFTFNSNRHTVTVTSFDQNTATIKIASDPITITLKVGEEKIIDIDSESNYLLGVKLNSAPTNRVSVSLRQVPRSSDVVIVKKDLLDVELFTDEIDYAVGDIINAEVKLYNLGNTKRVDIKVDMQLLDANNEIVTDMSKTLAVETTMTNHFKMEIPAYIESGKYNLKVIAYYLTRSDEAPSASQTITIRESQEFASGTVNWSSVWNRIYSVLQGYGKYLSASILLILAFVGFSRYCKKRKYCAIKKPKKKKVKEHKHKKHKKKFKLSRDSLVLIFILILLTGMYISQNVAYTFDVSSFDLESITGNVVQNIEFGLPVEEVIIIEEPIETPEEVPDPNNSNTDSEIFEVPDTNMEPIAVTPEQPEQEEKTEDVIGEEIPEETELEEPIEPINETSGEIFPEINESATKLSNINNTTDKLAETKFGLEYEYPATGSGLVAYWPLDEGTGTNAEDVSSGYNGTITDASWVAGKFDTALSFDGAGDYVNIGDVEALDGNAGFTDSAWFKFNSGDNMVIFYKQENSDGWDGHACYVLNDDTVDCRLYGNSNNLRLITPTLTENVWYHIAFTYDGSSESKVYLNGVENVTNSTAPGDITNAISFIIGAGNSLYFNGTIDEVAIWNRDLSAAEVQAVYRGVPPTISFEDPTPADALSTTTTNHEFNVSISEANLEQFT